MLNVSLICLSLKYFNKNYELMSNVSKWIHLELNRYNYTDFKFIKTLNRRDLEFSEVLVKFNKNKNVIASFNYSEVTDYDCDMIKLFLDNEINVDKDELMKNMAYNGRFKIVQLLIDNKVNIHNNYLLTYACLYNQYDLVKFLLENGVDIHMNNDEALILASQNYHTDMVKLLIDNGANVCANNNAALISACNNANYDVVKLLLENGADIYAQNSYVLKISASYNRQRQLRILLNSRVKELERKSISEKIHKFLKIRN